MTAVDLIGEDEASLCKTKLAELEKKIEMNSLKGLKSAVIKQAP